MTALFDQIADRLLGPVARAATIATDADAMLVNARCADVRR
jgi:hypothetical protein